MPVISEAICLLVEHGKDDEAVGLADELGVLILPYFKNIEYARGTAWRNKDDSTKAERDALETELTGCRSKLQELQNQLDEARETFRSDRESSKRELGWAQKAADVSKSELANQQEQVAALQKDKEQMMKDHAYQMDSKEYEARIGESSAASRQLLRKMQTGSVEVERTLARWREELGDDPEPRELEKGDVHGLMQELKEWI